MIILSLQGIRKSFGTHEVLKDASLTLQDGERMGLVGVNGSGKSTLMKIIAGQETADGGTLSLQKGMRIGYLAQQGELSGEETVLQVLESVFAPVLEIEEQMRGTEQEMAEAAGDPEALRRLGGKYDSLTRAFEEGNGYGWRSQGADAAEPAGAAAAGRAHQPSGPEEHRMAGGLPAGLQRRGAGGEP